MIVRVFTREAYTTGPFLSAGDDQQPHQGHGGIVQEVLGFSGFKAKENTFFEKKGDCSRLCLMLRQRGWAI